MIKSASTTKKPRKDKMTGQGNVHVIVTCTRRKTVPAGDTLFADERDASRAYGIWLERLAQARRGSPP